MSKTFAICANALLRAATAPMSKWSRIAALARSAQRLTPEVDVTTARGRLRFHTASKSAVYWPRHAFEHEPETIQWLDTIGKGDVLWDVGANVGAYSMYAALGGAMVVAFEPNPFTFHALARNLTANGFGADIKAVCAALSDDTGLGDLFLPGPEAGTVLNVFGGDSNSRGRSIASDIRFAVPGVTIDRFLETFSPPFPTHIKIDVDGIEDRIIAGAPRTLADPRLRSVLIEMDSGDAPQTARIENAFAVAGLSAGPRHKLEDARFYNQIFQRV